MSDSAASSPRRKPHLVGDGSGWMVQRANTTFRGKCGPTALKRRRRVVLPAVEPGVNRPCTGSNQHQGHGEHRQHGAIPHMGTQREGNPRFGAPGDNSGDGRPQTGNEKDAGQSSDQLRRCSRATGSRKAAVQQSSADQQSLNQKPGAWRTLRERGEQPLHMYPDFSLRESQRL